MLGFSLSGILYFVIGLILVHALVFGLIYVYLGKIAAAAKQHPPTAQKEFPRDRSNKRNHNPMGL